MILYPNADPLVSQYVELDLPQLEGDETTLYKTNVFLEKFPEKIDLKDISLDLERGYVVSQKFQPASQLPKETKGNLSDEYVGKQITLEYLNPDNNSVSRSYSGEYLRIGFFPSACNMLL